MKKEEIKKRTLTVFRLFFSEFCVSLSLSLAHYPCQEAVLLIKSLGPNCLTGQENNKTISALFASSIDAIAGKSLNKRPNEGEKE